MTCFYQSRYYKSHFFVSNYVKLCNLYNFIYNKKLTFLIFKVRLHCSTTTFTLQYKTMKYPIRE